MKRHPSFVLVLLRCALFVAHCDTTSPTIENDPEEPAEEPGDTTVTQTPTTEALLAANDISITLTNTGGIRALSWSAYPSTYGFLNDAGLWLAGRQQGEARALIRIISQSNYIARKDARPLGVFTLTPDSLLNTPITNWPTEYGAPTDEAGQPRLFGDMMLWSAFVPDPTLTEGPRYEKPFTDLYMTLALFAYQDAGFRDVVFARYEIINDTAGTFDDLFAGFYADADVEDVVDCYSYSGNAVGYDSSRALSYTYPSVAAGDADLDCPVKVIGFTVLESPVGSSIPETITSHPVVWKNRQGGFREGFLTTDAILYRLQGLSMDGEPMINPVTRAETRFAFTGDPVTQQGWLGERDDVRSLLAAGPFTLAPGEKNMLTVAITVAQGAVLSEALERLRQNVDLVHSQPEKWRF